MSITTGKELRRAYLEYFRTLKTHPHPIVPSSPIVPPDDPTLLFTSAGMVQFKALYSGTVDPMPYVRAASCQKCLRAGGKGSDLENVGKTLRHHTLFEMLGNFSFGDYFKREAIRFAWEFCTSPQWMNLPKERMFPTIYGPTREEMDVEAVQYYREETDCPNPLIPLDAKENFWGPAGETGACGPCSEIKFFLGTDEELAQIREELRTGGDEAIRRIGQRVVDEGDLFLEIWNMVFPQYDQQRDGSRPLLKNKGIDTGAGLERMTVALNFARTKVPSTPYETDLLWPITQAVAKALGISYKKVSEANDETAARERLFVNAITDHTRTLVFCLAEGITPGNVGRRYVVRRIQRRALRFASLLGHSKPFMADLYDAVVEAMGDQYPEIKKNPDFIRKSLRIEEETFLRTLDRGTKILNEAMAKAKSDGTNTIAGEDVFRLWDTYGFPVDLTAEIAEDNGLKADIAGYETAMKRQKEEGKKAWKGQKSEAEASILDAIHDEAGSTDFVGYTEHTVPTHVVGLVKAGTPPTRIEVLQAGEEGLVILDQTPFYAEAGGQIGDTGVIFGEKDKGTAEFTVTDTQKTADGLYIHRGKVSAGELRVGQAVVAQVDDLRREKIRRNHSSVHLLQSALKRLVGEHITQAGSYVGPDYARFDFTHTEPLTREQLAAIQREVNALIVKNAPVTTEVLSLEEAKAKGAIAPFGEKYGAVVRVVSMGPESIEFCGGIHARATGDLARFRILSESSIAAGVRRLEFTTGLAAADREIEDQYHVLAPMQSLLAAKGAETLARVQQLQNRVKDLEKELAKARMTLALKDVSALAEKAVDLGGARLAVVRTDGLDGNEARALATALRDKLGETGVAAVLSAADGKVSIVAAVGKAAQAKYPAGTIVNKLAAPLGGKGGGKPDLAQAGARDVEKLDEVVQGAQALLA